MSTKARVVELARRHFAHSPLASGITEETRLGDLGKGNSFAVGMFPDVIEEAFGVEFSHRQYERLCKGSTTLGKVCRLVERLVKEATPAASDEAA